MSTSAISLPDLVRGLILESGISQQEAAIRSGVSPGSVAALCTRTPKPLLTWLQQVAALGLRIEIGWQDRTFRAALPRIAAAAGEREWRAWRKRRMATAINHLRHADPAAKGSRVAARATAYAGNEEERLRLRLRELRSAATGLSGQHRVAGLRAAVQLLAGHLGCNAEELTLLSGTSLSACQLALRADGGDGRLATIHRLLSALGGRLRVVLPAGQVELALCPPGDWRPGMAETDRSDDHDDKPITAVHVHGLPRNRGTLDAQAMLALFDQGLSIGEIARQAGVSRQRVHKLAMDHGRQRRRQTTSAERVEQGRAVLGLR